MEGETFVRSPEWLHTSSNYCLNGKLSILFLLRGDLLLSLIVLNLPPHINIWKRGRHTHTHRADREEKSGRVSLFCCSEEAVLI
jgi:hypothetical protein